MVILHRFQVGMADMSSVDSAIDLGIILESLFLPDQGAELSYRLKMRAGKLLGQTVDERETLSRHFGKLYDIRSTAVHTGELPRKPNLVGLIRSKQSFGTLQFGRAIDNRGAQAANCRLGSVSSFLNWPCASVRLVIKYPF
jgi:hypothetical protein